MIDTQATVTLTRDFALLAEPAFGARAIELLPAGAYLSAEASENGFTAVASATGARGYLPSALCATSAPVALPEPRDIRVVQLVALYHNPKPGGQYGARWLVQPDEALNILEAAGLFYKIRRPNGQVGYVPATLCRTIFSAQGRPAACRLVQTVALYQSPAPGGQFESRWQIDPSEPLIELGRDSQFVLVQREQGELGYVPSALCGKQMPEAILPVGSVDLGWIAVGGGWAMVNFAGVAWVISQLSILGPTLKPYFGLAIVLGVAGALWLGSRRKLSARSFAIGVLLAYALLHFNSDGVITLWR